MHTPEKHAQRGHPRGCNLRNGYDMPPPRRNRNDHGSGNAGRDKWVQGLHSEQQEARGA
ncbi:hypothetical protein [Azospirillum melinis]